MRIKRLIVFEAINASEVINATENHLNYRVLIGNWT